MKDRSVVAATVARPYGGLPRIKLRHPALSTVQRLLGALLVVAGAALLTTDSLDWDVVLFTVSAGRGIDLSDVLGWGSIAIGIALLWVAPRRR
jgi:hypothetical protein